MAGRPNNSAAIANYVQGLREAKAAFQALPESARDRLLTATDITLREIKRLAQAKIQASPSIRTRALFNSLAFKLNLKSGVGKVGVTSGETLMRTSSTSSGKTRTVRIRGVIVLGKNGGQQGARLIRPSRYAHLVEFGARHMKAEPFMMPAVEAEKGPYLDRCRAAGPLIEKDAAKIGGGSRLL